MNCVLACRSAIFAEVDLTQRWPLCMSCTAAPRATPSTLPRTLPTSSRPPHVLIPFCAPSSTSSRRSVCRRGSRRHRPMPSSASMASSSSRPPLATVMRRRMLIDLYGSSRERRRPRIPFSTVRSPSLPWATQITTSFVKVSRSKEHVKAICTNGSFAQYCAHQCLDRLLLTPILYFLNLDVLVGRLSLNSWQIYRPKIGRTRWYSCEATGHGRRGHWSGGCC